MLSVQSLVYGRKIPRVPLLHGLLILFLTQRRPANLCEAVLKTMASVLDKSAFSDYNAEYLISDDFGNAEEKALSGAAGSIRPKEEKKKNRRRRTVYRNTQ